MQVGDLVKILGSREEGPEATAIIGIIMSPWKIDEWWEIITPTYGVVHWPETQISKVKNEIS